MTAESPRRRREAAYRRGFEDGRASELSGANCMKPSSFAELREAIEADRGGQWNALGVLEAAERLAAPSQSGARGDWMQTFRGGQFWPLDPKPAAIEIEDIAHSLSMQCRYAGHCIRFYSVAEHSVHVANHLKRAGAPVNVQLWGLLHDASEAYLVDVPRPLKPFLPGYREAERRVMAAVAERFSLGPSEPPEVKKTDNRILCDEAAQNMAEPPESWDLIGPPLGIRLRYWWPELAKEAFLKKFHQLSEQRTSAGGCR
jgi:hypothetical protein